MKCVTRALRSPERSDARSTTLLVGTVLLACLGGHAHGELTRASEIPLPTMEVFPGADVAWVAKSITYNGLPMSVRAFESPGTPAEVVAFYRTAWRASGSARVGETRFRDYQTLGMEMSGVYYSIQVRPSGHGSAGVMVVSRAPADARADRTTAFPVASGDRVLEKIESIDLGVRAESLIISTERSMGEALSEYRGTLQRLGWWEVGPTGPRSEATAAAISLQRNAQQCQISFVDARPRRGSRIIIHWIKGPNE